MSDEATWVALARFIRERLSRDPAQEVGLDTPLLSSDLVDSFSVTELIHHVETTYGVKIPAVHRTEENFDTVRAVLRLVERLLPL